MLNRNGVGSPSLGRRFDRGLATIFAEKEIFFRSQGRVRFIKIGLRIQLAAASVLAALVAGWIIGTVFIAYRQVAVAHDSAAIEAKARDVAVEARRVDAVRASVDGIAKDVARRQDMLDDLVRSQFGGDVREPAVVQPQGRADAKPATAAPARIGSVEPMAARLRAVGQRQTQFARHLAGLVNRRAERVEAAIRSFGLDPSRVARQSAQGGPFVPWSRATGSSDTAMTELAQALGRLNSLELGLAAIPSGRPTHGAMLSSSYGYRRDPFNGEAAFHAGVDFPGSYGQPVLAAAAGRVSFVGMRQGYGRVVEVDHGAGMMTRYAHLSDSAVRPGDQVPRGKSLGRMGSTGRSTGPHLHFEVRVNGAPINPRRFLEVRQDVLQVQQNAKQRVAQIGNG